MNELEKQLKDWKKIKKLCSKVGGLPSSERKPVTEQLYDQIKTYAQTYNTKFDFNNPPK